MPDSSFSPRAVGHLSKRLIPCLDVRDGRLTKGVRFQGNEDIGDPVETARRYYEQGADEIVFYDITASHEARGIFLDVVERVASAIFIPFSVGGGIASVEDMRAVLLAGAEKVSLNSAAVKRPELIADGAAAFGSQAVVVGMDVRRVPASPPNLRAMKSSSTAAASPPGWTPWPGRGVARNWARANCAVNSIDADGTLDGYELTLTRLIADAVTIPVIASGGAGAPQHLTDAVTTGGASAALVASIVHYGAYSIPELKTFMRRAGVPVRMV